jgi:hypothetical protein
MPPILCFSSLRHLIALAALLFAHGAAHACLFARDAKPQDWYQWANVLLAADVTNVEQQNRVVVISLRVVEAFKGPEAAATATLRVPSSLWAGCKLERPAIGARVLAALNANNDALLVPLTPEYAERLRAASSK